MPTENPGRLRLLAVVPVLALLTTVAFESTRGMTVAEGVEASVDAAAAAAAAKLGNVPAALEAAHEAARTTSKNRVVVELAETDIELGVVESGVFRPVAEDFESATAVRVSTTQAFPTVLATVFGVHSLRVTRSAVRTADRRQASRS
jgi:hypothetical protein